MVCMITSRFSFPSFLHSLPSLLPFSHFLFIFFSFFFFHFFFFSFPFIGSNSKNRFGILKYNSCDHKLSHTKATHTLHNTSTHINNTHQQHSYTPSHTITPTHINTHTHAHRHHSQQQHTFTLHTLPHYILTIPIIHLHNHI